MHINTPEPGLYKLRTMRGGPWVRARITRTCHCTIGGERPHEWTDDCDRFPRLTAFIDGNSVPLWRVWPYGRPVDADEYARIGSPVTREAENETPAIVPLSQQEPVF